jgi:diadenosine tetraphosphate (Ap4A) HIT family hydrolase
MRMSHIYQPLLIKGLIEAGGTSTIRQMALTFLTQDESQILYYEDILKKMPIKVLSKHGVIARNGDLVELQTKKLSFEQKAELKKICEEKLQQYIASRGLSIWDYRLLDTEPVPDSLRYRVLKDAKGRCALCGVTKNESPLDVDHIIPRSKGGKTVYENLQILCAKCNRSKRNKDDTDFRGIITGDFEDDCTFCKAGRSGNVLLENDHVFAISDAYPVTKGHTLVIPKRHIADYFEMFELERTAANDLIRVRCSNLLNTDSSIDGYNIGVNSGESAGQTIFHTHLHLIPRRRGDTRKPRGGVRGVIPSKMDYKNDAK